MRIMISEYESLDELYDDVREDLFSDLDDYMDSYGYDKDEHGEYREEDIEEVLGTLIDEIYYRDMEVVEDADDLKRWWAYNGWTLDRGYGGPNYKERLLEEKDWDYLYEVLVLSSDTREDTVWKRPVEVNDIVLFGDEDLYDDEDLDELYEAKQTPPNQYN